MSVPVTGLTSDTTYHVRVVATNAAGVTPRADRTFRTLAPARAAGVSTSSATHRARATRALLRGSLDPRGQETTYRFEYGTTTKYGSATPAGDRLVDGLQDRVRDDRRPRPYTTYHFRLVALERRRHEPRAATARCARCAPRRASPLTRVAQPGDWGDKVTLTGQVLGTGVGGTGLTVQRSDFPFIRGIWIPRTLLRAARTRASRRRSARSGRRRACSSSPASTTVARSAAPHDRGARARRRAPAGRGAPRHRAARRDPARDPAGARSPSSAAPSPACWVPSRGRASATLGGQPLALQRARAAGAARRARSASWRRRTTAARTSSA